MVLAIMGRVMLAIRVGMAFLILCAAIIALVVLGEGAVVKVGPCESIQATINMASPGDVIMVRSGTYNECININKPLTIFGMDEGNGMPILLNEGDDNKSIITLNSSGCIIKGMIIKNPKNCAINILSNYNLVDGNTIIGGDTAIYLSRSMSNVITHNNISVDKIFGRALIAVQSFNNTIEGNIICFSGLASNGIYLVRSNKNIILDNKISGNSSIGGSGISTRDAQYNILKNNWIETCGLWGSCIYIGTSVDNSLENNKVEHRDSFGSGITIYFSSRNNISNNTAYSKGKLSCNGIFLRWSTDNGIYANKACGIGWEGSGVTLLFSEENELVKNEASNGYYGIYLGDSGKNKVEYNIAQRNSDHDIYIDFFCPDNSIKHNTASLYVVEPRWSHLEDNSGRVTEFVVDFPDQVPIFTFSQIMDLIYNTSQLILGHFIEN